MAAIDATLPSPEKVRFGDRLSAKSWNALVDRVTAFGPAPIPHNRFFLAINDLGIGVPAFSAFTVDTDTPVSSATQPVVRMKRGNTPFVLTNGAQTIPSDAGSRANVKLVDRFYPSKLRADSSFSIGDVCGPTDSDFRVSADGTGLIAVTETDAGVAWFVSDSGGGGASRLCKATSQIPARAGPDTPGLSSVQPVKYEGGLFVDDGDTVQILSWVNAPSADPAQDEKLFIYVWIEQGTDGFWYWTGEDCPIIEEGDPIITQPGGGDITSGSNTIIVT